MTITITENPIDIFNQWFAEAEKSEPNDPTAMNLATADKNGRPSSRMVLLKGIDDRGFVFYTNLGSRKSQQLEENMAAALCFHWKSLRRQVRIEGLVETVSDAEADEYFDSRPRVSRIGAWASKQSQLLEGRWALEKRVAEYTAKFNIGHIPRPEFWSGYRVIPDLIEFWQDQPFRLHDRLVYHREGDIWKTENLFP